MRLWNRLRYLLHRRHFESELDEELRIHREMAEENLRRGGAPPLEARHAASRVLGNVTVALEDSRAQWNFTWLETLFLDLRYALRSFLRAPTFAMTVIGTIGLALGLNAALFSIFNAYVLRPFTVRDPYSLYEFGWNTKKDVHYLFTAAQFDDSQRQLNVFSDVMGYSNLPYWVRSEGQDFWGAAVSGNYFTALGVGSALGRTVLPRDAGSPNVMVISHAAWKSKFGAAANIIGQKLLVRGYPFEVIGVARPGFGGLGSVPMDFWFPLAAYELLAERQDHTESTNAGQIRLVGRLKRDVTTQQMKAALRVWAGQQTAEVPDADRAIGVSVWQRATSIPLDAELLLGFSPIIAAFALVLLIACANVANMMLARAMARQREIGIRLSLGAGRWRLVRQLITESLLLALPAAAVGFIIAQTTVTFGVQLLFATIPQDFGKLMRVVPLEPDFRVFVFVLGAAWLAALFFGLAPAIQATRPGLMYAVRGDFSTDSRRSHLRNGLIISQVTVCVLLLICAAVLLRTAKRIQARDFGLDTGNVLALQVGQRFHTQVAERLASEPSVETVAAVWRVPFLDGFCTVPVTPVGRTASLRAGTTPVSPEYFSVFRIPLLQGRNFTNEESIAQAPVVIVSEATARRFWPNQDALGQTIRIDPGGDDPRCKQVPRYRTAQVIGIARNVTSGFASADAPEANCLYFPTSARTGLDDTLLVRVKGDIEVARRDLDILLEKAAPGSVNTLIPMSQVVAALTYPFRVAFWISSFLGGLALVLTVSGIYGVMSYLVSQRTKEIGIRIAMGATAGDVSQMILKKSMTLAVMGVALGGFLALGVSRVFSSLLVMMNTFDGLAYASSITLVLAAAAAASYFPSRRAAEVDPASTLRSD